jgi:diguanylate cyclase (GGDEF)-like protein
VTNEKTIADKIVQQMAELRTEYVARLPGEMDAIETLAQGLRGIETDRSNLDGLHHRLHKLAGSGGTFGFTNLGNRARVLEQRVKEWLSEDTLDFDANVHKKFVIELGKLRDSILDKNPNTDLLLSINSSQNLNQTFDIWLVEDDIRLGKVLSRQLESFNYSVRLFTNIADAEHAAQHEQPSMLIMDVMFDEKMENSTQVLAVCPYLRKFTCPLLFISATDDFQSRVRAVQLGAVGYFLKPLDVSKLAGRMAEIFEQMHAQPNRVLIVDDDVDLSKHYRLVLLGAGMEVEVLHQPELLMKKISAIRPELILLDMHMPEYTGEDLAGVIRQHDNYRSLPIVYLSAEVNLDKQIAALNRGADDFLTKPISNGQLIAAVNVRIQRARQLEGLIVKDGLTGLLKHASFKEALELDVKRGRRLGKPVSVAMLDIDHFKRVNDTFGHATGDVVITAVALLLRQRLRQSDVIGRYGGEEFAVLLQECNEHDAKLLMEDIRQSFSEIKFNHAGKEFACTLSGGLVCSSLYPKKNGAALLAVADEALYVAKHGGRNQIFMASTALENESI